MKKWITVIFDAIFGKENVTILEFEGTPEIIEDDNYVVIIKTKQ